MESKQQIGRQYRINTLFLLTRLGYATTRQIAAGVFGKCDVSSRKMAGRTVRALLDRGYLVAKREGDTVAGEQMVALTRAGATAIAKAAPLPASRGHARDWLRHAHEHRTVCNSVFAAMLGGLDWHLGWTELEIRAGLAPPELSLFQYRDGDGHCLQKIPDLLLDGPEELDGQVRRPTWIEVENAYRGARDFTKLVWFLRRIFGRPAPPIEMVWLVVTSPAAKNIGKRLHAAMTHSLSSGYPCQIKELDARILANHIKVKQLDPDQLTLSSLP